MNVYDFDKTIYNGDSSIDFIIFLTKKYPRLLKYYPSIFIMLGRYKLKKIPKLKFKSAFFKMIREVDLTHEVELFWKKNFSKIKPWYLKMKTKDDLIISASPDFLIREICSKLGVNCLASEVNPQTGEYLLNFYGEEKVKQFKAKYPKKKIKTFYTDSVSDRYLAALAEQSYLVKKNKIEKWRV